VTLHEDKTYACVEGPRLGTRAESLFCARRVRISSAMTNVPEAFLALEAQLGYCTIALRPITTPASRIQRTCVGGTDTAAVRSNLGRVQQLLAATVADYRETSHGPAGRRCVARCSRRASAETPHSARCLSSCRPEAVSPRGLAARRAVLKQLKQR